MMETATLPAFKARAAGALKAEHLLHLRLEIADPNMLELFEPLMAEPSLRLVSLMDHTPGQRQWRDHAAPPAGGPPGRPRHRAGAP